MWILSKWIVPALSRMWLPVVGAFGVFLIYAKGKRDQKQSQEVEELQDDLETIKRIQNVKTSTTRDAALERLRKHGDLRD